MKRFIVSMLAGTLLLGAIGFKTWGGLPVSQLQAEPEKKVKVYPLCMVLHNPDEFKGYIGLRGKITHPDYSKKYLILTCGEQCEGMTVRFEKLKPRDGEFAVIYGRLVKEKSGHVFVADKIISLKSK